jgi:hypothetical protein
MMRIFRYAAAALALVGAGAACKDALDVENENNPDRETVLKKPTDVEGLASSLYQQILNATLGNIARTETGMMTASFMNASGLANNGLGPRSALPRGQIDNGRGNPYATENLADFRIHAQVARSASDILARVQGDENFTLGSAAQDTRLFAWTHFNFGLALGNLALVYDSAAIPHPDDDPAAPPTPLVDHPEVMTAALAELDSAIFYANKPEASLAGGFPTPSGGGWMNGNALSAATFIRLARSYKARFRAGVARTPTERAAVKWNEVIADATNGITANVNANMDFTIGWDYAWLSTGLHFRDANWHQMTPYVIGMADTSGAYNTWLATPRDSRAPILIRTPDLRFPAGETRAVQAAAGQGAPTGRRYFRNRNPGLDQSAVGWQSSFYDHYRWRAFADAGRIGPFPVFTVAENDMLAAEGYIRTGNFSAAATLIDKTRTTSGLPSVAGITSLTQSVPGGNACVPRVPVGPSFTTTVCGSILEAMKWEKRMETAYTSYGAWFFDSRGWGDLAEGTALEWPVPFQELDARVAALYNLGGVGGAAAAGPSTYGFGSGSR